MGKKSVKETYDKEEFLDMLHAGPSFVGLFCEFEGYSQTHAKSEINVCGRAIKLCIYKCTIPTVDNQAYKDWIIQLFLPDLGPDDEWTYKQYPVFLAEMFEILSDKKWQSDSDDVRVHNYTLSKDGMSDEEVRVLQIRFHYG